MHPFPPPFPADRHLRLAPQATRRAWASATLLGHGLGLSAALLEQPTLALGAFLLLVGASIGLNRSTAELMDRSSRVLDERLRATRDVVYRSSYLTLVVLVSAVGSLLLWWPNLPAVSAGYVTLALVFGFFLFVSLPTLLLAWNHPDALEDAQT